MNNAKVLSALLGVWKNLRIKKLRLSPTLITILITSLSCNLALSAGASTYSKDKNEETTTKTVDYPLKKTQILLQKPKSLLDRALSPRKIATVEEEKINPRKSSPNCKAKVAASTPKCSSQRRSVTKPQQSRKNTANTLTQKNSRQNIALQQKNSSEVLQNATSSAVRKTLTLENLTSLRLSQNNTFALENQTPSAIEKTLTLENQPPLKLSQNNTPTPENQTPPTTPPAQTPTPENQTPPTTPSATTRVTVPSGLTLGEPTT